MNVFIFMISSGCSTCLPRVFILQCKAQPCKPGDWLMLGQDGKQRVQGLCWEPKAPDPRQGSREHFCTCTLEPATRIPCEDHQERGGDHSLHLGKSTFTKAFEPQEQGYKQVPFGKSRNNSLTAQKPRKSGQDGVSTPRSCS